MANYDARIARLEQRSPSAHTVTTVGRDDAGRFCVSLGGRTWVAKPDEAEHAFAARVQREAGRGSFVLTEADARL
jgi:hypothetical protein